MYRGATGRQERTERTPVGGGGDEGSPRVGRCREADRAAAHHPAGPVGYLLCSCSARASASQRAHWSQRLGMPSRGTTTAWTPGCLQFAHEVMGFTSLHPLAALARGRTGRAGKPVQRGARHTGPIGPGRGAMAPPRGRAGLRKGRCPTRGARAAVRASEGRERRGGPLPAPQPYRRGSRPGRGRWKSGGRCRVGDALMSPGDSRSGRPRLRCDP